ncbi:carboxyl transferase domain-containing protein [Streptomyces sp. JJ36]|uniref:carboxyl transferase domain-containing protein n=1 Tax=Streptomyces sp. JJ36 TaxID=2736645 RepID=UPI001F1C5720|nr:carboxyl transferase domain-containing protein [Streptomyces sp. JJ36]MCF6525119.1 acetyl-CoA carboxylase [Streptomyces sp. JJ36]
MAERTPARAAPAPGTARALLAAVAPDFTEFPAPPGAAPGTAGVPYDGPLGWDGYGAARERAATRTGEAESVVCGRGRAGGPGGPEAVLVAFEFGFLGGSLGERTGDLLEDAHVRARAAGLPVVALLATGGSRMQEGMRALSQLQRVARQSALTREAGLPQLAVVRDPATGGGWATLGAGADVVLALPGAQAGFAGSRVRPDGAEPYAYTAEGQYAAGHVDQLVTREELPDRLSGWLSLLTSPASGPAAPPAALPRTSAGVAGDDGAPTGPPRDGWEAVTRARAVGRPRADAYLAAHFTRTEEIRGDRCGGTDDGVRCGFGRLPGGTTVAFAAQLGTATLPAGFRTAARLIRLADRLGIPVLTLVDTPGAANDAAAEQAGTGAAVADCFAAVASARVPVTTLVVGEGGSGGALALAAPGRTWVTADSYFSVIAPELAAAILKRGDDRIRETADQLRLRPQDLLDLGVARGIVGG